MNSQLEARFVVLLKAAKVPKWERNKRIPPLETKHEADFIWFAVPRRRKRQRRANLAVMIDGGIHKLKLADDCRRDCLCAMLDETWTVFRFADTQLELGARCVKLWHLGRMAELLTALRDWRAS